MKRVLPVFLFTFLVSCAPVPTLQILPTATLISVTFDAPTATVASPSPTSTLEPCDPFRVDFCITDGHFIFQRPIELPANTFVDVTYPYASTANGAREPHHGVEFLNKFGTPVHAVGDGAVIFAGPDKEAIYSPWLNFYGNVVVIQHADDLYTLYAHLSRINVEVNQQVAVGDQIGEVGQSGVATGSHLHLEVRRGKADDYFATVNPELWLIPNKSKNGRLGVLQISIMDEEHHLVKSADFTLEYSQYKSNLPSKTFYGVTYSPDMLQGNENAVMGDMPAGYYRIAFKYHGQLYERRVEVESDKLTQVTFVVK